MNTKSLAAEFARNFSLFALAESFADGDFVGFVVGEDLEVVAAFGGVVDDPDAEGDEQNRGKGPEIDDARLEFGEACEAEEASDAAHDGTEDHLDDWVSCQESVAEAGAADVGSVDGEDGAAVLEFFDGIGRDAQ